MYGMSSPGDLPLPDAFLARRPAIILDRDGVLNERPSGAGYVTRPEDFRWLPGSLEALRLLHQAGYRVIIATNQAGIGRGLMTEEDLEAVHAKMLRDVQAAGAHIEAIYYCPHGPDEECVCRKPKPGMLLQAQRDHLLDLSMTWFIGDDERDGQAAAAAGCRWTTATGGTSLLRLTRELIDGRLED